MKRRRKRNRPGRKVSPENRLAMLVILLVVCLLFSVLALEGFRLQDRYDAGVAREEELRREIQDEEQRTESIRQMGDELMTDEYIRRIARERLGLVESGELVLKQAE